MPDLGRAFTAAVQDNRVDCLALYLGCGGISIAQVQEIHDAIDQPLRIDPDKEHLPEVMMLPLSVNGVLQ